MNVETVREYCLNKKGVTESFPFDDVSLVVKVNAQVITFLSTSELETKTEIPLVVQIVNGQVPDFAPYSSSSGK